MNGLPANYEGTCTIVVNDTDHYVAVRNLTFLSMLCDSTGPDENETAEAVLHMWYSAALTQRQSTYQTAWMMRLFDKDLPDSPLCILSSSSRHGTSTIGCFYPEPIVLLGKEILKSRYEWCDAKSTFDRVRLAPHRVDYREVRLAQLRPRHRAARMHWLRSGVIQPLGSSDAQFNEPNR